MNKLVKKWEITGLLKNLNTIDKVLISNYLEQATNLLFKLNRNHFIDDKINSTFVPIVSRITKEIPIQSVKHIFDALINEQYILTENGLQDIINSTGMSVDKEAEQVSWFCDNYIKANKSKVVVPRKRNQLRKNK